MRDHDTTGALRRQAALSVLPWRPLHNEPHRSVLSVRVFDPLNVREGFELATVELILPAHGPRAYRGAVWVLWTERNDGVTPEHTTIEAENAARPFDVRRDNGAATDVLLAFVAPWLRDYLLRLTPDVAPPSTVTLRAAIERALVERPLPPDPDRRGWGAL